MEIFKKEYEKKGDDLILKSYIPADGTYVVVIPKDDDFVIDDKFPIKMDRKTRKIDRSVSRYINFVCLADYYSRVADMNKAILSSSGKVIQGNNYLSFIIKKESLTNGKLTHEIIDKYYSFLENPRLKYAKKPKSLTLYESTEKKLGEVDKIRLNSIKEWIKNNIFESFTEYVGKDYLKIFFYYPEDYKKESERYLIPNIYNNNDYNQEINDTIYGLPNDNLGLNAKKPYLEHKTRKNTLPYLISQDEVMYQKKFFDYLMSQVSLGRVNIFMGDEIYALDNKNTLEKEFKGIFLRIKKGKEVEIRDFDIIAYYNPRLQREFEYKNVLDIDYDRLNATYDKFETIKELHNTINEVMFNKFLTTNYFTEPKDIPINDGILKYNLLMCRTALFNWFYKGSEKNIWKLLNKASLSLVKGSINSGHMTKANDQYNLRLSLKEYFEGGEDMADVIRIVKENLRNKVSHESTDYLETDREYFFAVGQLVSFLLSRSKGKKKPLSLANPFINAKKDRVIKDKLKALYKKYNHDIESYNKRFKNLYSMIISYEVEGKIDDDMIIAGYLHSNLVYESKDNTGGKEDE